VSSAGEQEREHEAAANKERKSILVGPCRLMLL
jgi:hypothetical protein